MKRLSMFLMLVALIGVDAFAQTGRTIQIKQNFGLAKPSLFGDSRPSTCDTFINLCVDDTLVLYSVQCTAGVPGGYVCGQNCTGDISDADIFGLPGQVGNTTITGCLIFFAVGKAANTKDQFNVRVYDHTGLFADGGTGAPGTILQSKTVKYNTVKNDVTNGNLTAVTFSTPIAFPADSIFYMGIDFTYKSGDTVAMVNVLDRNSFAGSCAGINTSVNRFSDGTWHRFTDLDSWQLATSQMILPILCSTSCSITITPSSATICKGKSTVLTASGATTFTWTPATGLNVTTGATVTAKPTATTTYTVKGDGGSCSNTVKVTVNTSPTATISAGPCISGAVLLTRNGTPTTGVKFQWIKGSTNIAGATNSTYSATQTASYKVKVTIIATNCNKTSAAVSVTISCKMAEDAGAQFNADAYPNPFINNVTVNISSVSTEAANVKLMDFSGRIVREYKNVDPSAPFEINEDLAPGVYFIRVNQGINEKMIKVVKD